MTNASSHDNNPIRNALLAALVTVFIFFSSLPARATASYTYKKGEYVVIDHGHSPNKHWSLATHGDGEDGYDNFHVYLMAEPRHRKIGPLEEINEILDTAADAYTAVWSPDSRHVAILWRSDRHFREMILYRIENGRAYRVSGPNPLDIVMQRTSGKKLESPEVRACYFTLEWQNATHFTLTENDTFRASNTNFLKGLGKFGISEKMDNPAPPEPVYMIYFAAKAEGELTVRDRYRLLHVAVGTFDN
jgi:hypothetical protein